jgi:hypothetical protein
MAEPPQKHVEWEQTCPPMALPTQSESTPHEVSYVERSTVTQTRASESALSRAPESVALELTRESVTLESTPESVTLASTPESVAPESAPASRSPHRAPSRRKPRGRETQGGEAREVTPPPQRRSFACASIKHRSCHNKLP